MPKFIIEIPVVVHCPERSSDRVGQYLDDWPKTTNLEVRIESEDLPSAVTAVNQALQRLIQQQSRVGT